MMIGFQIAIFAHIYEHGFFLFTESIIIHDLSYQNRLFFFPPSCLILLECLISLASVPLKIDLKISVRFGKKIF